MKLKSLSNALINGPLKSLGYRLISLSDLEWQRQRYASVVEELCNLYAQEIFRDLPDMPGRSKLLAELEGTNVSEAIYLIEYLHKSLRNSAGDVCEFGVAQGCTSSLLAHEIHLLKDRDLWLFDSFQGLSKPGDKDKLQDDIFKLGSMDRYEGSMAFERKYLEGRLASSPLEPGRFHIIEGFIDDLPAGTPLPSKVCFAYIDFDLYQPILTALNMVHTRMSPGGHLLVDDYGYFSTGAKTAVEEFLCQHKDGYEMFLPPKYAGHFCVLRRR